MNDVVKAPVRSVLMDMAHRFGMEPAAFEATVRATCIKPDKSGRSATREEFAAFLLVAKEYGLNPLTKEIFAFVDKGAVVPVVSVDGWANIINSHPACDGFDFLDLNSEGGEVISVTCRMHRKDRGHPVEVTEYLAECRRDTDPWRKWPRRMLRHKALIQAARYAFGFAGIYEQDEAERIREARDVTPAYVPMLNPLRDHVPAEVLTTIDAETGEVTEQAPAGEVADPSPVGSEAAAPTGDDLSADLRDEAHAEGWQARRDGKPRKAMPDRFAPVAASWNEGYDAAKAAEAEGS